MICKIHARIAHAFLLCVVFTACSVESPPETDAQDSLTSVAPRPDVYAEFSLTTDLSSFSDSQREMISVLIEASQLMDDLFWRQAYGDDYQDWLASIRIDEVRRFAVLNYGPWDRLDDEKPFVENVGAKPPGANFYPDDMTKEELEAAYLPGKVGRPCRR